MPIYHEPQDKVCHSAVLHSPHQTQGFGNWTSKKKSITYRGTPQGRNSGTLGLQALRVTDSVVQRQSAALIDSACCYQCHRDR
jgi:hypothetical protein